MLAKLTINDFSRLLNSKFSLKNSSEEQVEVTLIEVTELHKGNTVSDNSPGRVPFSLLFSGPMEPFFPQGTYTMKHSEMKPIDLFIVPVGPDDKGMRYEVIFN